MALVVPLMVILMFGGFEGGYYMWNEHKVVKAVRDGARFAGRQQFEDFDCGTGTVTDADTAARINSVTRTGTIDPNAQPIIAGWTAAQVSVTVTCGDTDAGGATNTGIFAADPTNGAKRIRVIANTSYKPLFSTLGFSTTNLGLRASSEAVVMGL